MSGAPTRRASATTLGVQPQGTISSQLPALGVCWPAITVSEGSATAHQTSAKSAATWAALAGSFWPPASSCSNSKLATYNRGMINPPAQRSQGPLVFREAVRG